MAPGAAAGHMGPTPAGGTDASMTSLESLTTSKSCGVIKDAEPVPAGPGTGQDIWMQTSCPCPHQPFAGIFLDISDKLEKEPTLALGSLVMMRC